MIKVSFAIELPWNGVLRAFASATNGQFFIVTQRAEAPRYVVHRYEPGDGSCHGGDYRYTLLAAMQCFSERVTAANGSAQS